MRALLWLNGVSMAFAIAGTPWLLPTEPFAPNSGKYRPLVEAALAAIPGCTKKPLEIALPKSQQNAPFWAPNLGAVLYLRVSTTEQTTANQERELREIAAHARGGCRGLCAGNVMASGYAQAGQWITWIVGSGHKLMG